MKRTVAFLAVFLIAGSSLALTKSERRIAEHAQTQLREGAAQFEQAKQKLAEADARAAAAEQHAAEADSHAVTTDAAAAEVGKQIEVAHANEQRLANDVQRMKPIYDRVYKWWGVGAIVLGFGILAKHLLILALVLLGIGVAVFLASFFFPVIGIAFAAVRRSLSFASFLVAAKLHPKPKPSQP